MLNVKTTQNENTKENTVTNINCSIEHVYKFLINQCYPGINQSQGNYYKINIFHK